MLCETNEKNAKRRVLKILKVKNCIKNCLDDDSINENIKDFVDIKDFGSDVNVNN